MGEAVDGALYPAGLVPGPAGGEADEHEWWVVAVVGSHSVGGTSSKTGPIQPTGCSVSVPSGSSSGMLAQITSCRCHACQ